jgi:GLPGLI family protein
MKKILVMMMALVLTMGAQGQVAGDGYDDLIAAMVAAKMHLDSIDESSLVAVYDYECRTQDAEGLAVTDKMKLCVQVGRHCTRSYPYRKFRMERERTGKERTEYMEGYDFGSDEELPNLKAESYCFMPEVWTNYPDGKTTVRDAIVPSLYETREERRPISWTLSDDTLTFGGHPCKTATCQFHGRKWTVRYAEDIPTSAGPWKLCGLPGLILHAECDGGIHRFVISDITRTATPIYYGTNAITTRISEEKLIKNRIKTFGNRLYPKNPYYYIAGGMSSTQDVVYCNDALMVNGVLVNDRAHVFQPLEME